MKKFLNLSMQFKLSASLIFTATIVIFLIINLFSGEKTIPTALVWQSLLVGCVGAIFQLSAFNETIIKKLNYVIRSVIFCVPMLLFLTACAIGFRWFPTDGIGYWLTFVAIFIAAFIGISIGFGFYYKFSGQKLNEKLSDYQQKSK